MEYSNLFVCLMGLGTVFFGLICIILLTYLMGYLCRERDPKAPAASNPAVPAPEPSRPEMIAAVSAALAKSIGTNVSGIRILSLKRI